MWFISRCISIDSLNSCFQQQKTKTSYDFCLCRRGSDVMEEGNDKDDCESLPKKLLRNNPPRHIRRRLSKRYSDIVGPTSTTKLFLPGKDPTIRDKQTLLPRHHSLIPINETFHCFNSHYKKSREIISSFSIIDPKQRRYNHRRKTLNPDDLLAHRMQAAMSSELMHSLDRNFVFGERPKQSTNRIFINRSHSFTVYPSSSIKSKIDHSYHPHLIPRVKLNFDKENLPRDEPTPDYDEEIIIHKIKNNQDVNEEPIIDYEDSKPMINDELDDKSLTQSSFIIPQTSTSEEQISTPPVPPPLPNLINEQKIVTLRCRTIADKISPEHKLIRKDEDQKKSIPSKSHYFNVSKDVTLRKLSRTLSRSYSSYGSISQLNDRNTESTTICPKPSITDEQIQDGLSSSSPATSILVDNEDEHRSSSSKIYHDYKKRASLISVPTSTILNHSIIIHPMHTRIGLRSSTSSSSITNEKLLDMTLSSKQMNVCVINQLNEHLSTRFRKQQQKTCSKNNTDQQRYDPPPTEYMPEKNGNTSPNFYDEPNDVSVIQPICSSSVPPTPPPLPVGGFRPIIPPVNRLSNSQRTSIMTLPREANHFEIGCSTGTSTISSNLSNTRILHELRANPLFTKAKQHLEIEPGSNGRRSGRCLVGSTSNLASIETRTKNETVSYLRLDTCLKKSNEQMETIIMHPNELNALIGKRTKSIIEINQVQTRKATKSSIPTQCRQSELELIFQKRAQRSEKNLI